MSDTLRELETRMESFKRAAESVLELIKEKRDKITVEG
ncbi:unnamed protein product, partial [Amoebophrya sp. A25]|eukprot:GSA25T00014127001.1